jgi:hypothetical protein
VPENALLWRTFLSLPDFIIEKPRAACPQGSDNHIRKLFFELSDSANPQNEDVPLGVGRSSLFKAAPRHHDSLLQGSLLAVKADLEDEFFEVSFRHQQPVSGGGSRDSSSKLI